MAKEKYLQGLNREKKVDMSKELKNRKYVNMCDHKKMKNGIEVTLLEPIGDGYAKCTACKHVMPIEVKAKKDVAEACDEVIGIIDTVKAAMKNPSDKQLDELANIMLFLQSLPDIYKTQYADVVGSKKSSGFSSDFEERLENDYMNNGAVYINTSNAPFGHRDGSSKKNKNKNKKHHNGHGKNKKRQKGSDIFGLS